MGATRLAPSTRTRSRTLAVHRWASDDQPRRPAGLIIDLGIEGNGQTVIISADTPGSVYLVSDYMPRVALYPWLAGVQMHTSARWQALDVGRCKTVMGTGLTYGIVVLFRDGYTDDEGTNRVLNVESATQAQGAARGCPFIIFGS